ncbi:MAG TPA: hypothetical protein PLB38_00315 [bacterium]|nr:hypothetical protein [bacterium]
MGKKRKKKVHHPVEEVHQENRPMEKIKVDKEKEEEQTELLEKIYAVKINDEFSTDDLTKFYHRKRTWWMLALRYFLILAAFVGVGLVAGYFYFTYGGRFTGSEVAVSISGNNTVVAGETVNYEITYHNQENAKLKNLKMIVNYPDNFVLLSSEPAAVDGSLNTWNLPDLGPNSNGKLLLTGYFTNDASVSDNIYRFFDADFYYNSENFNSLFNASAQSQVVIRQPAVLFNMESLGNWQANQNSTIVFNYENQEESNLNGLVVKANLPNNFVLVSSQPELTDKKPHDDFYEAFWKIDELLGKTTQYVLLDGYFKDAPADQAEVQIYGELFMGEDDKKTILADDKVLLSVEGKAVSLGLKVLDQVGTQSLSDQNQVVYKISYSNQSGVDFKNVELELFVDDFISKDPLLHILNWNRVADEHDGSVHRTDPGAKINWDQSNVSGFALLKDGESGEFSVTIDRQDLAKFTNLPQWREFAIKNHLQLTYEDEGGARQTVDSQIIIFDFKDALSLKLNKLEALGSNADGKFLYKLNYDLALPAGKTAYNIEYRFSPADKVNYLDWLKDSNLNQGNQSVNYSQYYDENAKQAVVKFSNSEKCLSGVCSFSLVFSSAGECVDAGCLLKSVTGQAWVDNQRLLDR